MIWCRAFPSPETLVAMNTEDFERLAGEIAAAARTLGVNCFLAPILDRLTGPQSLAAEPDLVRGPAHHWPGFQPPSYAVCRGRAWRPRPSIFPGYADIPLDPAMESGARCGVPMAELEAAYAPFAEAIAGGVSLVMTGPAIVDALDAENAASLSSAVIHVLREKLGFEGVILSDDLDAPAVLRGGSVPDAALQALNAGADLLLLADTGDQIEQVARTIAQAVATGQLAEERLSRAADKVRALCRQYGP